MSMALHSIAFLARLLRALLHFWWSTLAKCFLSAIRRHQSVAMLLVMLLSSCLSGTLSTLWDDRCFDLEHQTRCLDAKLTRSSTFSKTYFHPFSSKKKKEQASIYGMVSYHTLVEPHILSLLRYLTHADSSVSTTRSAIYIISLEDTYLNEKPHELRGRASRCLVMSHEYRVPHMISSENWKKFWIEESLSLYSLFTNIHTCLSSYSYYSSDINNSNKETAGVFSDCHDERRSTYRSNDRHEQRVSSPCDHYFRVHSCSKSSSICPVYGSQATRRSKLRAMIVSTCDYWG